MPRRIGVMLGIAAAAAAPIGAAGPAQAEPACSVDEQLAAPPTASPRYTLTVRVHPKLDQAGGSLSVRFSPERDTDRIVFRLWANSPYLARKGAKLTVADVKLNRAETAVRRPNPTTLVVDRSLSAGETALVSMTYTLRLPGDSFDRLYSRTVVRLGSFFPLLAWNPDEGWQTDPPSAIGWETWTSPTADFEVRVTAPRGLQVLASGEQVGRGRWRANAVRDFALAVGRLTVATGTAAAPGPFV